MTQTRYYSSVAPQTTLAAGIGPSDVTCNLAGTTGLPGSFPFTLALDYGGAIEELVDVTNLSGTIATIVRAVDGTTAASHASGAFVRHVSSARDFTAANAHQGASSGVHGVTGSVVGTTDTQVLTNKTLTAPAVSAPVVTGGESVTGASTFTAAAITDVPVTTKGFSGQTADLMRIQDSTSTNLVRVLADGRVNVAPSNAGSTSAIVNAPSGMTGSLQEWQVNGTKELEVQSGGAIESYPTATGNKVLGSTVTGDTNDRVQVMADGKVNWGPGNVAPDTNLYRAGANILKTDDAFQAQGGSSFTQGVPGTVTLTVNGPNGLPATHIQQWQNNGTTVSYVDQAGNYVGGIAIPASSPGFTSETFKAADTSRTSTTTVASDPDLVFGTLVLQNGGTYRIDGWLNYSGAAIGTGDIKLTLAATSGSVSNAAFTFSAPSLTGINTLQAAAPAFGTSFAYASAGGTAVGGPFHATFTVTALGTAVALQWAQNSSSSTATILKAGSRMTLTRIA